MDLVVRAFPLKEDKREALQEMLDELRGERCSEAAAFYRRYGVARETLHLQETPAGPWVICVTQIPERSVREVAREYAESATDFDRWFKSRVLDLTEVDPDLDPLGPPTECLFDTRDCGL